MKSILFAAALGSLASLVAVSGAQADSDDLRCGNVPVERWMGEQKIREKAGAAGIEVNRVSVDEGCYEVEGRSRDGQNLDVRYNPETGEQVSVDSNDGGDNDGGNDSDNDGSN